MPAPEKTKKPKKLDKGSKKSELSKKKKGSGNLLIILSVVGVVVLLAVGITIFILASGETKKDTIVKNVNPNQGTPENNQPESGAGANAPNLAELTTKANDLIEKLADADKAKSEEAAKQLREMLESDVVTKIPGGAGSTAILTALKDKAMSNDAAKQFMLKLTRDNGNAALAQKALKIYNEFLKQPGESTGSDVEVAEEPTNYLPNKVDIVFSLGMKKFMESEYNNGVFTLGAFNREDIPKRIGMAANTVEQFVVGGVKDFNQVVGIIRTTTPYNWDEVKRVMQLEESGNTVKGKTYYLGKVDFMTEFLGQRVPGIDALREKAAIWRVDVKTLVYADEVTMKDLMENPPERNKTLEAPSTASLPGGNAPAGNNPPPAGGAGLSAGGIDGGTNNANNSANNPTPPGGGATGPGGAAGTDATAKKPDAPLTSERYSTIDAKMRRLIKLTEDPKHESLVLFTDKTTSKVPVLINYVTYLERLPSVRSKEIDTLVFALPATTGSPSLRLGLACKSRAVVRDVTADLEKLLGKLGKEDLHDLFGFDFTLAQTISTSENQSGGGGGGGFGAGGGSVVGGGLPSGAGANDPGGEFVMSGSRGGQGSGAGRTGPGGPPGGTGGAPGGLSAGAGGGLSAGGGIGGGGNSAGMGIMGAGGNQRPGGGGPGGPGGPGQDAPPEDNAPGTLRIERSEEYIIITASVKSSLGEFIEKHLKSWMQQVRGSQEIASGKFRFGDLAASMEYYKADLAKNNKVVTFPQGAFPRTFDAERGPRPYPANERISFLRELLPYLSDDRYFSMNAEIDQEKSWRDPHNLKYARILIPHFLNPAAGPGAAYVKVRGVDTPLAATHFVGMAGVGPDAAYLPKSNPRAGIFGYDRVTSPEDVKDGLSNTIYMIEADKALLGPWLEGGGSTVRGTSVAGNDVGRRGGFSSPNFSGKPGVWVLMADGSTRFLTKDISPEVFKALCTMAGSDSAGAIDLIAGKVNLEVTPRNEQSTAVSTTRKKRVVEEEEVPVKK